MKTIIYPVDGKPFVATEIKPTRNACGCGYRVVDEQNRIMFYQTKELADIMPYREQ